MTPESQLSFGPHSALVAKKYRLDNGLGVILLRDPSAPIVAYHTWFQVGSRNEVEGRTGIAHLFEHLMFNQTETLPPGEFDRRIESFGGETNAATWVDWTFYMDSVPKAALPEIVTLEAERMQRLTLGEEQVESEREVVANERRQRVEDTVDGVLSEELYKAAFTTHPYHWPTIGWMRDIEAITIDDCRAFYRTYYAPNNATVVIVGDFAEADALALVKSAYGAIAPQAIPKEAFAPEPRQQATRRLELDKPVPADRLQAGWRAVGQGHEDYAALEVVCEVLAGGNFSRLHRSLVVDQEIASSVSMSVAPFRDPGLCDISVSMTRGHRAEEAEEIVQQTIADLVAHGPRPGEVDGAKARLLTRFWSGLRQQNGKAEALGHAETTLGDYRRLFDAPGQFAAVDAAAVVRVCETYLRPELLTSVIARPSADAGDDDDDEEDER